MRSIQSRARAERARRYEDARTTKSIMLFGWAPNEEKKKIVHVGRQRSYTRITRAILVGEEARTNKKECRKGSSKPNKNGDNALHAHCATVCVCAIWYSKHLRTFKSNLVYSRRSHDFIVSFSIVKILGVPFTRRFRLHEAMNVRCDNGQCQYRQHTPKSVNSLKTLHWRC